MQTVSMIILAGGRSSRMGTDKADLRIEDRSFLQIQLSKADALQIPDVCVSGYRGQQELSCPVIPDLQADQGPLGGLATCLGAVQNDRALVLSVDAPLVPAEELEKLVDFALHSQSPATIVRCADREYPLVGVYHRSLIPAMRKEIAEYRGSVFAMLRRVGYSIYESSAEPALFANVNDPESYQALLRR